MTIFISVNWCSPHATMQESEATNKTTKTVQETM